MMCEKKEKGSPARRAGGERNVGRLFWNKAIQAPEESADSSKKPGLGHPTRERTI